MRSSIILLLSSILPLIHAQQAADGLIVPFTSDLPVCASLCGPLYDVQGACTPPNIAATSSSCFCSDSRLQKFTQGTAQVSTVCSGVCTAQADLQKIQDWYESYCNTKGSNPTTTSAGSTATATSGASSTSGATNSKVQADQTWFQSHWKWVVVIIVIFVTIVVVWVGACALRRRHIRKKEREIELKPPVAWGPHQMQSQTNGYSYGDGVMDAGGHSKEANRMGAAPADTKGAKRESTGWLRKNRA